MIWHGIDAGEERWGRELVWAAGDGAVMVRGRRGAGDLELDAAGGGRESQASSVGEGGEGLSRGDKPAVFFQNKRDGLRLGGGVWSEKLTVFFFR
jgi:hypothetical protein